MTKVASLSMRPAPAPRAAPRAAGSILAALGVAGMDHLEPVFVAALVTEKPLLLIGNHGTGKSWLLVRLAEAMGLSLRHYNASLLGFDDLVGFPLPDGEGGLRYVPTPASVWGAQAVFLDEISRTRPEVQNKLFSILHEKKVQGLPIESLVHRWSAMNPPASEDGEDGDYTGSERLDLALADRFAFIVEVPAWADLSSSQRQSILLDADGPVTAEARNLVVRRLEASRAHLPAIREESRERVATYVEALLDLLPGQGIQLSARRAVHLLENVLAVHAAALAASSRASLKESAFLAVSSSLPQPATGTKVDRTKLLALHRKAWGPARPAPAPAPVPVPAPASTGPVPTNIQKALECLADRADVSSLELSIQVADALSSLPIGARHALAYLLAERKVEERLTAPVAEQWAGLYGLIASGHEVTPRALRRPIPQSVFQRVAFLCTLRPASPRPMRFLANLLAGQLSAGSFPDVASVDQAVAGWSDVLLAAGAPKEDLP